MIYSNFTCTKYIAVQSGTSNRGKDGILGNATPTELCRFINGEIYHATAILGQIRTKMDDFKKEMKRWQQILFQCGGDLYITNGFNVTGKEVTFLKEWLSRLESTVKQPKNFVLPSGHQLNPLFHQISAIVTQGERWFVQASKLTPLSDGVRTVLYLSSQIAFLLSLYVNEAYGYDHEYVYE